MEHDIIYTSKHFIQTDNLVGIQHYWNELLETEFTDYVDIPTVFQTIYLHACLKRAPNIAHWLQNTVYPTLDPIMQIGLRQVFSYGETLLKKRP
jgi:hypothetical protein